MRIVCCGLFLAALALLAVGQTSAPAQDDFKLEPGFTLLFNGKDLTGWTKANRKESTLKAGDSLEGKAEAYGNRFKVAQGKIVIDPAVKGDVLIATAKTFGKDVHIKFEFLVGDKCNNDFFIRGNKFDITAKGVKNLKDGWNTLEIIITGDKAEFKNNGESVRVGKATPEATPLGVRAEFGAIELRRMRYKE